MTRSSIHVIKKRPGLLLPTLNRHAGHLAIFAATLAELLHGA